jgi:hypothetical protein
MSSYSVNFKRGLKANLPTLPIGHFAYTTDTKELYVGSETGNIRLGGEEIIDTFDDLYINGFTTNLNGLDPSIKNQILGLDQVLTEEFMNGFTNQTDSTIAYNHTNRTFTISGTFEFYNRGTRHKRVNSTENLQHPNEIGKYYFYYDYNTLVVSTELWDFELHCPIAIVIYNNTSATTYWNGPSGFLCEERHGHIMDWKTHENLHFNIGTYVKGGGFALSGYAVNVGNGGLNDLSYSIGSGVVSDEDISTYIAELTDTNGVGNKYMMFYKTGTGTEWRWFYNNLPILKNNSNNALYNQLSNNTWGLSAITTDNTYFNVYLCAVPTVTQEFRFVHVLGQSEYLSTTAADAENLLSLNTDGLPFAEIAPLYKITYRYNKTYSSDSGKCRIHSVSKIVGTQLSIMQNVSPANHNNLSNRGDLNSHPIEAINGIVPNGLVFENADGTQLTQSSDLIWDDTAKLLTVNGSINSKVVKQDYITMTSTTTATALNKTIFVNCLTTDQILNLPSCSTIPGHSYYIKKIGGNPITVEPYLDEQIEGMTNLSLIELSGILIQNDGSNWWVMNVNYDDWLTYN